MLKKLSVLLLCLTVVLLSGCKSKKKIQAESKPEPVSSESEAPSCINPLTGLPMDESKENIRPVAVMINNVNFSQPVQTAVNKADILYETEVEGGISRLMAVYKDIASVGQIGSVRSARYVYVDLALAHDAIYAHCGQDNTYCKPHLADIDDVSVETGGVYGGTRIKNGLNWEHTLYTYGDKLFDSVKKNKVRSTVSDSTPWQDFSKSDEDITLSGGSCKKIEIPFSSSYHTVFKYDEAKKEYTRYFFDELRKDYVNGEITNIKNIFVLSTDISDYPDKYRRKVDLTGGTGYYLVNGTYMKIKWSKGDAKAPFKFTDESGNPIKVNAGKSYVGIAGKAFAPVLSDK